MSNSNSECDSCDSCEPHSSTTTTSASSSDSGCNDECCNDLTAPYHSIDVSSSKKRQGKQVRTFQKAWFSNHQWLSYCKKRNAVVCFYCSFVCTKLGTVFSKIDSAFITKGFSNWKKAKEKFREHESSHIHHESVFKYESIHRPSVISVANTAFKKQQEVNRRMLLIQLRNLRFLMRQGLSFRGQGEEGNLHQLMKLQAEDCQAWLNSSRYQSPEIINELMELMSKNLLRSLLADIKAQPFYAIIADETRDISGREQLALSIRWVSESYQVHEDLIGLAVVEATDAASLKSVILDSLIRCGLSISNCCGQAYDGAANMSGGLSGVAARIQNDEPKALYVHCTAHCVNLCMQDCAKQCKAVRDALSLANEIFNFIKLSPKRLSLFESLQKGCPASL